MRRYSTIIPAALLVAAAACQARAQVRDLHGAAPIAATLRVTAATIAGDTTRVSYRADNEQTGGEDLWVVLMEASASPLSVTAPGHPEWLGHRAYKKQPAALWELDADELIHPGQSTPALELAAVGLPATVRYWAVPDLNANPPIMDTQDGEPTTDSYRTYGDSGTTVGVRPVAGGATPANVMGRLRTSLDFACGPYVWVTRSDLCQSLRAKLDDADAALAAGQTQTARDSLQAFVATLDAEHTGQAGAGVTDEGYFLLRPTAAYLIAKL